MAVVIPPPLWLGGSSNASGLRSVALGSGSVASADNVVSVGSGNAADAGTIQFRKIVNVANGTAANDAVNKGQLDAAAVNNKFIAINTGGVVAIPTVGNLSIAIGPGASAAGDQNVVIGINSQALAGQSIALGQNALTNGNNSTALGQGTRAEAGNGLALGQGAIINVGNAIGARQDYGCWRNRILPR
ncbi:MAG: hypothetical protein ACKVOS_01220 [Sphingorhabdus sp.]|uniref:hypothetical protein n=1 Tax=Sphingorhabdus sp. TaxID=1902408 RepID=UPI0038FBE710